MAATPTAPKTGPLSRDCPHCQAPTGTPCHTPKNKTCEPHAPRRNPGRRTPDYKGRTLTLTPETRDVICAALRIGVPIHLAAQAVGIGRTTLHRWLAQADSDEPDDAVFRDFRDAALRARGESVIRHVRQIDKAAQGRLVSEEPVFTPEGKAVLGPDGKPLYKRRYEMDWRAAMALLERGHPLDFGRREVVELQSGDAAELGARVGGLGAGVGLADDGAGRVLASIADFRARKELEAGTGEGGDGVVDAELVDG